MFSALELSIRFGIPAKKVEEICDFLDIPLRDESFDISKEFERVARSVKRKRASAGTIAFLYVHATDEQRDFVLALDHGFASEYAAIGFPITRADILPNAKALLDRLNQDDPSARDCWQDLADWMKARIEGASSPFGHNYIAVRILASLPEKHMLDYTGSVASVLNKLRHRGYLTGWFDILPGDDGKNFVRYSAPAKAKGSRLKLSDEDIAKFMARLGSGDPTRLAGFISYETKMDFQDVLNFLLSRAEKSFDL